MAELAIMEDSCGGAGNYQVQVLMILALNTILSCKSATPFPNGKCGIDLAEMLMVYSEMLQSKLAGSLFQFPPCPFPDLVVRQVLSDMPVVFV